MAKNLNNTTGKVSEKTKIGRTTRTQIINSPEYKKQLAIQEEAKKLAESFVDKTVNEDYYEYRPQKYSEREWSRMTDKNKKNILAGYERGYGLDYYAGRGELIKIKKTKTSTDKFTFDDYKDAYSKMNTELKKYFTSPEEITKAKEEVKKKSTEELKREVETAQKKLAEYQAKKKKQMKDYEEDWSKRDGKYRERNRDRYKKRMDEYEDQLEEKEAFYRGYIEKLNWGIGQISSGKEYAVGSVKSYADDYGSYRERREEARNNAREMKDKYEGQIKELQNATNWADYAKKYASLPSAVKNMISAKPNSSDVKNYFNQKAEYEGYAKKGLVPVYNKGKLTGFEDPVLQMSYSVDAYNKKFKDYRQNNFEIKFDDKSNQIQWTNKNPTYENKLDIQMNQQSINPEGFSQNMNQQKQAEGFMQSVKRHYGADNKEHWYDWLRLTPKPDKEYTKEEEELLLSRFKREIRESGKYDESGFREGAIKKMIERDAKNMLNELKYSEQLKLRDEGGDAVANFIENPSLVNPMAGFWVTDRAIKAQKEKYGEDNIYSYGKDPRYWKSLKSGLLLATGTGAVGALPAGFGIGATNVGQQIIDPREGSANKILFGQLDTSNWGAWKYPAKFAEGVGMAYAFNKVIPKVGSVTSYGASKIAGNTGKKIAEELIKRGGNVLLANYIGDLVREGYIGIEDIKAGKSASQLIQTGLEAGGFYYEDKVLEGLRKLQGVYNPRTMVTSAFPVEERGITIEKAREGLAGQKENVMLATGSSVREDYGDIFSKQVTDSRGGSEGAEVTFGTPKTGELTYTGEVFLNPKRNPRYWKNWLDDAFKNRKGIGVLEDGTEIDLNLGGKGIIEKIKEMGLPKVSSGNIRLGEAEIIYRNKGESAENYFKRIQELANKNQKVYVSESPKTVAGYNQPELEMTYVFPKNIKGEVMKAPKYSIGLDKFGNKIYKTDFLSEGKTIPEVIKMKMDERIKNYKWYLGTNNKLAKELAIDMKYKYKNIYEKGNVGKWQGSDKPHMDNVEKNFRKILKDNNIRASNSEIVATARLHDILKKRTYNFKDEPMIERALMKGYLDDIDVVKKLTPKEKARVAKTIGLHQDTNPNLWTNAKLDDFTKAFINADRLDITRYGSKVDNSRLFKLNGNEEIAKFNEKAWNEASPEIREAVIKDIEAENAYREAYGEYNQRQLATVYKNKSDIYDPFSKYNEKSYEKTKNYEYKGSKGYSGNYQDNYGNRKYNAKYMSDYGGNYDPHTGNEGGGIYDYVTKYKGTNYKRIPKRNITPPKKRRAIAPSSRRGKEAWQPVMINDDGSVINGDYFETNQGAVNEGMIATDELPNSQFVIQKVKVPEALIKKGRNAKVQYKFQNIKGVWKERNRYKKDRPRESNFNWMSYLKTGY